MRLIDGDALKEQLTEHLKCCNAGSIVEACFMTAIDHIEHAPAISAPQPNDPLTLEELRKMDGEPVWLSGAALNKYDVYRGECPSGWADFYWGPLSFGSYGKTWQAYRRKPEEGTT